nr:hypothetical protein [Spirochaetota bacterium]
MAKKIEILLKNGLNRRYEIDYSIKVGELSKYLDNKEEYIAAKINNEIVSLSYSIKVNSEIEFLTMNDNFGMEIYRRSLCFLLAKVADETYKDKRLIIEHSLGPGYYFEFENCEINKDDVKKLEDKMKDFVEKKIPIERERISYIELLKYFEENKKTDKFKLLNGINNSKLSIYRCEDFFELFDGPMV